MALDGQPAALHGLHHLGAYILMVIGGRTGESSPLCSADDSEIVLLRLEFQRPSSAVRGSRSRSVRLIEADVVEDEELRFRAEEAGRRRPTLQIVLRLAGNPSGRFTLVVLLVIGSIDVAIITSVGTSVKGSSMAVSRVGHAQHVALVIERQPRMLERRSRSPPQNCLQRVCLDRIGDVLPEAGKIGEAEIKHSEVVLLAKRKTSAGVFEGTHHSSSVRSWLRGKLTFSALKLPMVA